MAHVEKKTKVLFAYDTLYTLSKIANKQKYLCETKSVHERYINDTRHIVEAMILNMARYKWSGRETRHY